MQKQAFAIFAALVLAGFAHAEEPLLRKTSVIGFVGPAEQTTVTCQVFADRTEVVKQAAALSATIVTKIKIDPDAVNKVIAEAAKGKLTRKPGSNNEPLVKYQALLGGKTHTIKSLGSDIIDNSSDASLTLINFIDQLCE